MRLLVRRVPPSTPPPSPLSPPSPPFVESQSALMRRVRAFEEAACTSVYFLSTADRCNRLAIHLSEKVLILEGLTPGLARTLFR
eukprot:1234935-Prymnesium_polylepis.1